MAIERTILDLSKPAVQRFIKAARARGFAAYEELLAVLDGDEFTTDQIADVIAQLAKMGIKITEPRGEPTTLMAIAGMRRPHIEPDLDDPPMKAVGGFAPFVSEPDLDGARDREGKWIKDLAKAADVRRYVSDVETRQGMFLTASGTLTQFNAILAAMLGAALTAVELSALKLAIAAALILHVLAAFILCWAARPVPGVRETSKAVAVAERFRNAEHTFRNYRRGWRMTLCALGVSSLVAILFVLHAFGIAAPNVLAAGG